MRLCGRAARAPANGVDNVFMQLACVRQALRTRLSNLKSL
jgi:hypothetical protein